MTEDEQAAFDYAMEQYGFDPAELNPRRERLIRKSMVYNWHLLKLTIGRMVRDLWQPRPPADT